MNKANKYTTQVITTLLFMFAIVYLLPIYFIVINSFKPYHQMFESFISLPKSLFLGNYITAWSSLNFLKSAGNTFVLVAITVFGIIFTTSLAGYKLARYKGKLSKVLYMLFTFPFLIPFYTYMIPLVKLTKDLGLMNNSFGLALIYISSSSLSLFMFHGFTKTIPIDIEEAALIDGCSSLKTFAVIVLPLLKNIIFTVSILYILWTWNDFLLPYLILNSLDSSTIIIRVNSLVGKYSGDWDVITAALMMASFPVIITYSIMQKFIIQGIASGAVKG